MGEKLWDTLWEAGKKFNISPGCPNLIDRIEGGLMSYGNDITKKGEKWDPEILYTVEFLLADLQLTIVFFKSREQLF